MQSAILNNPIFDPTYINIEYFFYKILHFFRVIKIFFISIFSNNKLIETGNSIHNITQHTRSGFWDIVIIISSILSIIFITIIIFAIIRIIEIQAEEKRKLENKVNQAKSLNLNNDNENNTEHDIKKISKWQNILEHTKSTNPNDWRLAIIEADVMLDDLLQDKDFLGDSLGDRLNNAKLGDFVTLNKAWEAHKIRNRVVHEGTDYHITQNEVNRVVHLYEKVFKEFDYI